MPSFDCTFPSSSSQRDSSEASATILTFPAIIDAALVSGLIWFQETKTQGPRTSVTPGLEKTQRPINVFCSSEVDFNIKPLVFIGSQT